MSKDAIITELCFEFNYSKRRAAELVAKYEQAGKLKDLSDYLEHKQSTVTNLERGYCQ